MKFTAEVGGKDEVVDLGVAESRIAPEVTEESVGDALDERELADAKRNGVVKSKPVPTPEEKAAADKVASEKAEAEKLAAKKPDVRADLLNENPDPAKEAERIKDFNPNEKALYHERKKAIRRAQRAEAEIADLRKQLDEARKPKPAAATPDPDDLLNDGQPPKPSEPASETEEQKNARIRDRQEVARRAVIEQERDFKITHPDFDTVYDRTSQVLEAVESNDEQKLAEWFPSSTERRGVRSLVQDFLQSVAYADHPQLKRQAPEIAYEIGNLLLDRQKPPAAAAKPAEPPVEDLPNETDVEDPPPSSAPVSSGAQGSPRKIVDMTEEEYLSLTDDKAAALKQRFPKEFEKLMRKFS